MWRSSEIQKVDTILLLHNLGVHIALNRLIRVPRELKVGGRPRQSSFRVLDGMKRRGLHFDPPLMYSY